LQVITDADTKEGIEEAEVILMDDTNKELLKTVTDKKGKYNFDLDCETSYVIRAIKPSFAPVEAILKTGNVLEFKHDIPLEISHGGLDGKKNYAKGDDLALLLALQPIYFDRNKSDIRKDAEIELQKIIVALDEYPALKIDVRSHTDSRAKDSYNLALSERRAQSTIKYILEKGKVDPSRVTGKGYGETALVNKCANDVPCTPEEHQLNRRSEFIIVD